MLAVAVADVGRPRFALVIGNASYRQSPLENPLNDAVAVAHRLEHECGFHKVMVVLDAKYSAMKAAIDGFVSEVNRPELLTSGRVALVHFSGHGAKGAHDEQLLCPIEPDKGWTFALRRDIKLQEDIIKPLQPAA
jgi:uncharacterized caspase-like protein